jgi:hypothetical protein
MVVPAAVAVLLTEETALAEQAILRPQVLAKEIMAAQATTAAAA